MDRVPAEYPVTPVIGLPDLGQLPDDFAVFRYPNVRVIGDRVFILYAREWFELAGGARSGFEDERSGEVVLARRTCCAATRSGTSTSNAASARGVP